MYQQRRRPTYAGQEAEGGLLLSRDHQQLQQQVQGRRGARLQLERAAQRALGRLQLAVTAPAPGHVTQQARRRLRLCSGTQYRRSKPQQ